MAVSAAWTFSDAGAYEQKVRAAQVSGLVVNQKGPFEASLQRLNVGRIWTQHGSESGARSLHMALDPSRSPILFLADENTQPAFDSGLDLLPDRLMFYGIGASSFQRTAGPFRWSSMSIPPQDLEEAGRLLLDKSVVSPRDTVTVKPLPGRLQMLRSLHRRANGFAWDQMHVTSHGEIERAMESELVMAMLLCLDGEIDPLPRRHHRHRAIIRKFQEWLEFNSGQPVYLEDVCSALNVTARTLRGCCQEHLGMGPIRYLWLRRMELARRALVQASPNSSSVTRIAMDYGFWELGRFSVSYRSLFGELPSVTIARSPEF